MKTCTYDVSNNEHTLVDWDEKWILPSHIRTFSMLSMQKRTNTASIGYNKCSRFGIFSCCSTIVDDFRHSVHISMWCRVIRMENRISYERRKKMMEQRQRKHSLSYGLLSIHMVCLWVCSGGWKSTKGKQTKATTMTRKAEEITKNTASGEKRKRTDVALPAL